jgi:hypothetical protein
MNDEVVGQLWKLIIPGYRNVRGTASYERYWLIVKLVHEATQREHRGRYYDTGEHGPFHSCACLHTALNRYGIDLASWARAEGVTGNPLDGEQL